MLEKIFSKKKIEKHLRYINIKKVGCLKIIELKDHSKIRETIKDVLFS